MKVAFHFAEDETLLYPRPLIAVFLAARRVIRDNFSTKVLNGTVLFDAPATTMETTETGQIGRVDKSLLIRILQFWLDPPRTVFSTLGKIAKQTTTTTEIFAVALNTVQLSFAIRIDKELTEVEGYVGAREIDDVNPIDRGIYLLPACARLMKDSATVFFDGTEDTKDYGLLSALDDAGLGPMEFESLGGRYTIFDAQHTPDGKRRVAECAKRMGESLGAIAENVLAKLGDAAPELADRLWAAMDTFDRAETSEQYAQVAVTCRRLLEYCAECVFPPSVEVTRLGSKKFRNRLLAFADQERQSETDIDLISASTNTLAEQIENLERAANKGIHGTRFSHTACRRCLIRTAITLDDIVSLRSRPFPIKIRHDLELIRAILKPDRESS